MENIIVKSKLDVKTFFNISMLVYFQGRKLLFLLIYLAVLQLLLFWYSAFDLVSEVVFFGIFLFFYLGVMPLVIYFTAIRRSKVSQVFLEYTKYTFSEDKIEIIGETVSATNNWKYITKCIEREKYFLLMLSARIFYYLPKAGFESPSQIPYFKNLVNKKGIKMKYH
jgi:hypothetical protein